MWEFSWKSEKKNFDSFFNHFELIEAKMKIKMKKLGKWVRFLITHIRIRLYSYFHENLLKKHCDPFLGHFWLIEKRMTMKDEKIWGKKFDFWILISISKLGNVAIFMKIGEKNEDEDEKIWKNEFNYWILHIKIRLYRIFHKNVRKKFFFEIFIWEGHTRTELLKELIHCMSVVSF